MKLEDHDLLKVYNKSKNILEKIRKESKPFFWKLIYRSLEHCGPNDDDSLSYRPKREINKWKKNCQVKKYEKFLIRKKILSSNSVLKLKNIIDKEINEAFKYSYQSKFPTKNFYINLSIKKLKNEKRNNLQ